MNKSLHVLCLQLSDPVTGLKVGFVQEGFAGCNDRVQAIIQNKADGAFAAVGMAVSWLSIPQHNEGISTAFYI